MAKKSKSKSAELSIGLGNNASKEVAHGLSQLLGETYFLLLKTQYYHWNVTGPNFSGLHLLFESQYNQLFLAVDEIAERIRALGAFTPGTFQEFLQLSSVKEDKALPGDAMTMVKNLQNAHEEIIRKARKSLTTAQAAGDEGSADLFIRRMQEHEKTAWMLRSCLQ